MTPFWTPFFARRKNSEPVDLPLSARLTTVEVDMLAMQRALAQILTTVKSLQGKVYRGVQLGDTTENAAPTGPEGNDELETPSTMIPSKQELYARAANLRRPRQ